MPTRLINIRNAPLTAKEIDWLTAAELYLLDLIELPLVHFVSPCFPHIFQSNLDQINLLWEYALAASQLSRKSLEEQEATNQEIQQQASRIYALEMQRILGAIFPLGNPFWRIFYQRQELEEERPLLALDCLHHLSDHQSQIAYQLLLQALKTILKAEHLPEGEKQQQYHHALRLIAKLPIPEFQTWIKQQIQMP
ncbi:MAG: hypothetical protein AAF598_14165 [Bacteroidota bacterium]